VSLAEFSVMAGNAMLAQREYVFTDIDGVLLFPER
jgi:hypothetical protein